MRARRIALCLTVALGCVVLLLGAGQGVYAVCYEDDNPWTHICNGTLSYDGCVNLCKYYDLNECANYAYGYVASTLPGTHVAATGKSEAVNTQTQYLCRTYYWCTADDSEWCGTPLDGSRRKCIQDQAFPADPSYSFGQVASGTNCQ